MKEIRRHRLRVVNGRKEEGAESTYTILIKESKSNKRKEKSKYLIVNTSFRYILL